MTIKRVLTGLTLFSIAAAAQETTGRVQGRVMTDAGAAIAGAAIIITDLETGVTRIVRSDNGGHFAASAIAPGMWRVSVRSVGYRELVHDSVFVRLGRTAVLGDVVLRPVGVELSPVVVRYDPSRVDPLSTTIGSTIHLAFAEKLPAGREYTSMATLLPQVTDNYHHRDGINIAGATGLESAYFVDGINVTEGYRHSGGIRLPYSFVDHIEVKTGGYEAEFGRASGGIVGVVTRSGSNTSNWSAFSSYTASSLASSGARSGTSFLTGDNSKYDAGFSVGGPIIRNRLWYFAAYDGAVTRENVAMPDGVRTDHARTNYFAGKLSWRPDSVTDVAVTLLGDPTRRSLVGNAFWGDLGLKTIVNPDPFLATWNVGGRAFAIHGRRSLGRLLLDGSLSHARFTDFTAPATLTGEREPLFIDFTRGEWSGGHGNAWDRVATRTGASFNITRQAGPHLTKVGIQFEDNRLNEDWRWVSDGPEGGGVLFRADDAFYLALLLNHQTVARNRVLSTFAQTSYELHPRLRVNAGLRWDGQYFSSPTTGLASSLVNQWQPRIGFVFYPGEPDQQKVTASLGRFYEQIPLQPASWFWGGLHQHFYAYDHDPRIDPSGGFPIFWDDRPGTDLRGQHFDEITLGWERGLGPLVAGIRGTHRELREVLNEFALPDSDPPVHIFDNPGRGPLSHLVRPISRYSAIEVSVSKRQGPTLLEVTYTWSRKYGNYAGAYNQDNDNPNANVGAAFDSTSLRNALGLLTNDRTHDVSALIVHALRTGLSIGATLEASSGTPITARAGVLGDLSSFYFIEPRGSGGRTPFLWDLSFRVTWNLPGPFNNARLVTDVLHAFGQRKAVRVDQLKFLRTDESGPVSPNPLFGSGLQFQPPMTLRLGLEMGSVR